LVACVQGLVWNWRVGKMVPPDNRCCFCLNLRQAVILIGAVNFVLYLLASMWYIGKVAFIEDLQPQISNTDISVLILFCVQLLVNLMLIIGAVKRNTQHIVPWLCSNAVVIAIIMVIIFMLVFFGAARHHLGYHEYVSALSIFSLLAGTDMFCCIVVFQFRKNLIIEERIELGNTMGQLTSSQASHAPPAYEDASKDSPPYKVPKEDPPPEYEAAIAMLHCSAPPLEDEVPNTPDLPDLIDDNKVKGPQLRKKSLTSNQV